MTRRSIGVLATALLLASCAPPPQATEPSLTPATSVSAPSPAPAPTTPEPQPVVATIVAAGDILTHPPVTHSAISYAGGAGYDYSPMFAEVAGVLQAAPLAICHMETPLSPDNTNLSAWDAMDFNTPHEMAAALAGAGYDACEFASNHTLDRGIAGIAATEQVIRAAGMGYAGPTAHAERAGQPELLDAAGVPVAHLAYTYTYPNDWGPTTVIPDEAPWLAEASWPVLGASGIIEQATAAKQAGAEFVVVSLHWGAEYQAMPTDDQRNLAHELLDSDAVDLILGSHTHVVQPCELINGKHVIYGMGNQLSNQSPMTLAELPAESQEGIMPSVTLHKDANGVVTSEMSYHLTRVQIPGHVVRLVTPQDYPDTWQRTTATVDLLGGCGATALA